MFGKLLKNDLKSQWHSVSVIFLCIAIIVCAAELFISLCIAEIIPFKQSFFKFGAVTLSGIAVMLLMLFACIVILITVGLLFSKTTFGRAGYLTLTLPVKTSSLIWSKTISGLIWTFVVYFLFFGSACLWFTQSSFANDELRPLMETVLSAFFNLSLETIISMVIYGFAILAIVMFFIVQCMYFSITCSHVSPLSKLSVFSAVIIFFASFGAVAYLAYKICVIFPFGFVMHNGTITLTSNVFETFDAVGGLPIIISFPLFILVVSVLLHFPITALTKHKVNVK